MMQVMGQVVGQVVMQVNKQKTTIRRDGCFFACRKIREKGKSNLSDRFAASSPDKGAERQSYLF